MYVNYTPALYDPEQKQSIKKLQKLRLQTKININVN